MLYSDRKLYLYFSYKKRTNFRLYLRELIYALFDEEYAENRIRDDNKFSFTPDHRHLFSKFKDYRNKDKKFKLLFYKYFIALIIKNNLVDEKFKKDYKKYQKVVKSFYS